MRVHGQKLVCISLIVGILIPVSAHGADSADSTQAPASVQLLDASPVRHLLRLMNTIIEENPDYEATLARLEGLAPQEFLDSCAPFVRNNAANPRIVAEVDALLALPAYQLYYEQFRNMHPDRHRSFLYALPYYAADGPADIGLNLLELCRHHREVAAWLETVVTETDMSRCLAIAQDWLSPGEYEIPKTYFIYDGNGDAFADPDGVCFDLFSIVLRDRSSAARFENLADIGTEKVERVLAHEFHHIHANPLIYAEPPSDTSWQGRWQRRIVCGLVSEGTAMHCDPRHGLEGEMRRDPGVIRAWVEDLNHAFGAMKRGDVSEKEIEQWWSDSFHDGADEVRLEFLKRRHSTENPDSLALNTTRTDLEHTLGWWMVSRISDDGRRPEEVIRLLSEPESLFVRYNTVIGPETPELLIKQVTWEVKE